MITAMKNASEGINSRLGDRRMHIDWKNRIMEITQSKEQKEKQTWKNEDSLRDVCSIKCINIHPVGGIGGEEREKGLENVFDEIMAKNILEPEERNRCPGTRSTENPRQDKPKETHSKLYPIEVAEVREF